MKVFEYDFATGTKGRELASIKCAGQLNGSLITHDGETHKVSLVNAQEGWTFHSGASYYTAGEDVQILPEDFGVEAICFCIGEVFHTWYAGHPEAESTWEWAVVGTPDWTTNAIAFGMLNAELLT